MIRSRLYCCIAIMILAGIMGKDVCSYAQAPPACHQLYCDYYWWQYENDPNNTCTNPDSVYVDTCHTSLTFEHRFAKKWFRLLFSKNDILPFPAISADSVVEVTWGSISITYPSIRARFSELEQQFGRFYLRREYPEYPPTDNLSALFLVRFEQRVEVEAVEDFINDRTEHTDMVYIDKNARVASIPNDKALYPGTKLTDPSLSVVQQPYDEYFWAPYYHSNLPFQYNHYKIKSPMAWEITEGRPDIIIASHDVEWSNTPTASHPDMQVRSAVNPAGNFLEITSSNKGDGQVITFPLSDGHGLRTLSTAIAIGNNDNPASAGQGIAGVAYKCGGLGIGYQTYSSRIDVDGIANNVFTPVKVATISLVIPMEAQCKQAIDSGIIVVSAVGNDFWGFGDYKGFVNGVYQYGPKNNKPGGLVWTPTSNPNDDYKVIAVSATMMGTWQDRDLEKNCSAWNICNYYPNYDDSKRVLFGPIHRQGQEQFVSTFNFSPGTDKFNTNPDQQIRRTAKEQSFTDLCAPTDVMVASNNTGRQYTIDGGTSNATPQVAATAALMTSVHSYLGVDVDLNNDGVIDNGPAVQRLAHKILTFTTDKLPDFDNIPDIVTLRPNCQNPSQRQLIDKPSTFNYISQTNDPLKRTWGQRMGFGRLNVYRAVAHVIANKGAYSYSSSVTLPFSPGSGLVGNGYINERGQKLMHFGSWKNATDKVLDVGGVNLPIAGEFHNNHGVTMVNGTGTVLTVPNDCVLAIDGIVQTNTAAGGNRIITSGSSKILMTGFLHNVELIGNTRLADLYIKADNGGTGRVWAGSAGTTTEVYGFLNLLNDGVFTVNDGVTTVMPDGYINMKGTKDISVQQGGTLILYPASTMISETGRKLIIEAGSTLRIKAGNEVNLLCEVVIKDGGYMIVEEDAKLNLGKLTVEQNGVMTCEPGSHVAFTQRRNFMYGKMLVNGTASKRVKLMGKQDDCLGTEKPAQATVLVVQGKLNAISKSFLHLQYADVSNAKIKVVDIAKDPIIACNFSADRNLQLGVDRLLYPYLLSLTYNQPLNTPVNDIRVTDVTVQSCTFFDEAGDVLGERSTAAYKIRGLEIRKFKYANIGSCSFNFLDYGVKTLQTTYVNVTDCNFENCIRGVFDESSMMRLCSNNFNLTDYGSWFSLSRAAGYAMFNTYNKVGRGYFVNDCADQSLLGNTYTDYWQAVIPVGGCVNLTSVYSQRFNNYDMFGRSNFAVGTTVRVQDIPDDMLKSITPWLNGNNKGLQSDIRFESRGKVRIACGRNDMATNSVWHMSARDPQTVEVQYNYWHDPDYGDFVRATPNITVTGYPWNVSQQVGATCYGLRSGYECGPSKIGCATGLYTNDGTWVNLASTDPQLDDYFYQARSVLNNTGEGVDCRREKAFDALQAATLGDSIPHKLQYLVHDYRNVSNDLSVPAYLRSTVLMLKGETHERLSEIDSAIATYKVITISYPTSIDSIPAAWNIQRLQAYKSDTTETDVYDSLMVEYHDRVVRDLRRMYTNPAQVYLKQSPDSTTESQQDILTGQPVQPALQLEPNIPNPFSTETAFRYTIPSERWVKLSITDVQGRIVAVIADGKMRAGEHEVQYSNQTLANGVYLLRLEAGGEVLTRQITVVK